MNYKDSSLWLSVLLFLGFLVLVFIAGMFFGRNNIRYQISSSSDDKAFVIDTETGEVWKTNKFGNFCPIEYDKYQEWDKSYYIPRRKRS